MLAVDVGQSLDGIRYKVGEVCFNSGGSSGNLGHGAVINVGVDTQPDTAITHNRKTAYKSRLLLSELIGNLLVDLVLPQVGGNHPLRLPSHIDGLSGSLRHPLGLDSVLSELASAYSDCSLDVSTAAEAVIGPSALVVF